MHLLLLQQQPPPLHRRLLLPRLPPRVLRVPVTTRLQLHRVCRVQATAPIATKAATRVVVTTVATTAHPVRLEPAQVPVLVPVPLDLATTRLRRHRECLARVPHATPKLALVDPVRVDPVPQLALVDLVRAHRVRPVPPVPVDLVPPVALRVRVEHVPHLA